MANTVFMSKTGLIGGEATKLDSIDGAVLVDGDAAFVNVLNVQYIYRLDADSGAAESSPNIIAPDTNPGTKRWILQGLNGASLNMPGLSASLPVFTDASKNLVSKSVADTLTALGVGAWTDYSGTSTVTGWDSFATKIISYKIIEKVIFVYYSFYGVSNSTSASFTIPIAISGTLRSTCETYDSTTDYDIGHAFCNSGSTVALYKSPGAAPTDWTSSGDKGAWGQFFYSIA